MKQKNQKFDKYVIITISLIWVLSFALFAQASEINSGNVIRYVNEARARAGLQELEVSEELNEVATAKVNDMVENKYFAHTSPKGLTPWHWFELIGYNYKYAGENLAINFTTAEAQQAAWMKSPTHKKNILNVNYHEIGVAVAVGEIDGTVGILAVQEFGTLAHMGKVESSIKNFTPIEDAALPDATKFMPTVLSVGDQKINESLKKVSKEIIGQKDIKFLGIGAGDDSWLMLLSLVSLLLVFMRSIFRGRFRSISRFKKLFQKNCLARLISGSQVRGYSRKLKVKNYGKYRIIKVREVTP